MVLQRRRAPEVDVATSEQPDQYLRVPRLTPLRDWTWPTSLELAWDPAAVRGMHSGQGSLVGSLSSF